MDQARKKALRIAAEVKDGGEPVSAAEAARKRGQAMGYTLDMALDDFVTRYARPNLRSSDEVERCFRVYVRPRLGGKAMYDLTRLDITELLDHDRGRRRAGDG